LESPARKAGEIFKLPIWIGGVESVGFVFCPMNLVTENVSHHQFFDESRLKQVLEAVFSSDFLCLANIVDDLPDVTHGLAAMLSIPAIVVERAIVFVSSSLDDLAARTYYSIMAQRTSHHGGQK
jgi:hypothetical protein